MTFRAYTPEPAPEPPVRPPVSAPCTPTLAPALDGARDGASIGLRGQETAVSGFPQDDALPQGRTQVEVDQVMSGIADVFIGAFNDALTAGRCAISALVDAHLRLLEFAPQVANAWTSGAETELDYYATTGVLGRYVRDGDEQ